MIDDASAETAAEPPELQPGQYRNINSLRLFVRRPGAPNRDGRYVLYWMQINRRLHYNHALEYAVAWANLLNKPLLIFEAVRADYPWASVRLHKFLLEGMQEHRTIARRDGLNYYPYVERQAGEGKGLLETLSRDACLVVSDEFPVYIIPGQNAALAKRIQVPFATVDANGVIPMQLSEHAPYSAYVFRRTLQKHFLECYERRPAANPLDELRNRTAAGPDADALARWPAAGPILDAIDRSLSELPIDQNVGALNISGTRAAGLARLQAFADNDLSKYADERNDPDANRSSGLSPYLHFGKVSIFDALESCFARQKPGWTLARAKYNNGSRGFFQGEPSIEAFLDEALTWREVGYHFCFHTPDYDRYESLPDWARATLDRHAADPRPHVYSLEQLEAAETRDEIWNAAQRQLRRDGVIHNYLRMLWGKKILEWTPDPRAALATLIQLNNKYSIDGRNPNSYSGIFWTLGRFDRPWGERPIFGQIRYMSSENTRKKIRMTDYLRRYGPPALF